MMTESFQEYKDYTIRLRAITGGGFGYAIIKYYKQKPIYLRKIAFNFISPAELLDKAKNYIDNHSDRLENKYQSLIYG